MRNRRARSERGAELVELAMVLPLLMIVAVGIIEFALLFQSYEVVSNAAREGARVAVLPGYVEDDIRARVTEYVTAAGLPGTLTVPAPTRIAGAGLAVHDLVQVSATYSHPMRILRPMLTLIGATGQTSYSFTVSSTMRCETQNTTAPFCQ